MRRPSMQKTTLLTWLLFMALANAFGQTGPTLVDLSYTVPPILTVAPGQIVNFNVTGLNTVLLAPVKANQTPLPTVLAGISVTLNQRTFTGGGSVSLPVPLLSIRLTTRCAGLGPFSSDCYITTITGQIPFEITVLSHGLPGADIVISYNGVNSQHFGLYTNPDRIHLLTVTHADGSQVTMASPAVPGEVVVVYALGLGKTNPAVPTGQPTTIPAPVVTTALAVLFDFTPNAGPLIPAPLIDMLPPAVSVPEFAGLTPGEVGLYQINVKLPNTFPSVPVCAGSPIGAFTIYSNLTINISDGNPINPSSDGAPICILPPS